MLKIHTNLLSSLLIVLLLTSCFHKSGSDNKPSANTDIIADTNGNDEGSVNNNADNNSTVNDSSNSDNISDSGNENTDTNVTIPTPTVPTFEITGTDVVFDYSALAIGYAYSIYFSTTDFIEIIDAIQVTSTPVLTEEILVQQSTYIEASSLTLQGLDLTQNQTVFIRILARDDAGNISELSALKQLFYTAPQINPTVPLTPNTLSALGSKITVEYNEGALSRFYTHQVYISTSDFSDVKDAFLLGVISKNRISSNDTWRLPDALQLDLQQDYNLYVRVRSQSPNDTNNNSALSDAQQIKYLAMPTDITNVTSIYQDLTIEWPVVSGKFYKVYINKSESFSFNNAASFSQESFVDGIATTQCLSTVCSIGITIIDGSSESAPLIVANFKINTEAPNRNINETVKTGEQYQTQFSNTNDGFSVYYSTIDSVSSEDDIIYNSEIDGTQTTIIHNISEFYDNDGDAITYYYAAQSFIKYAFVSPNGEAKTFHAYSLVRKSDSYTPVINDFRIYDTYQSQVEIVDGSLYSSVRINNEAFLHRTPLNGEPTSTVTLARNYSQFTVDTADTNTVYYITTGLITPFGAIPASLYKKTANEIVGKINLTSFRKDNFVDFVQSPTHLHLLTKTKVLRIEKTSISNDDFFEEMLILADSVADTSTPTDLAISKDNSTLYIASPSGILSIPTTGDLPLNSATTVSNLPVNYLAVNESDLYFVEDALTATINRISLATGEVFEVKKYVTSTSFLNVFGDWLYFSSGASNTYRISILDSALLDNTLSNNSLERIVKLKASNVAVDISENGEGIYMAANGIYHFPESFYTPPPALPTVGKITTAASDMMIEVNIAATPDVTAYDINGISSNRNTEISELPNGEPLEITVTAYNISGFSDSVTITDTPKLVTPRIINQTGINKSQNIQSGFVSEELSFWVSWKNIVERNLTLNIYRSTNPDVDISSTPIRSLDLTVPASFNYEYNYKDTNLVNGQFYYYRVVLSEATNDSDVSNEVSAMPYAPYVNLGPGSPKDGKIAIVGSTIVWASNNPELGIQSARNQTVQPLKKLIDSTQFNVAPNTTQLVSDLTNLYAIGSDNRVVKITEDLTYAGSETLWKEESLGATANVMNQLVLSDAQLYMANGSTITSFEIFTGIENELYSTTLNSIDNLVEKNAYLYWIESKTKIKRMRKTGDNVETLLSLASNIPIKSFDVIDLGDLNTPEEKIIYSMTNGLNFTIVQYNLADKTSKTLTEESLYASFALNEAGEIYVATHKTPSSHASYKVFVKIDATGTETAVRKGVPVSSFPRLLKPARLLFEGNSLYYTLPQEGIYKVQ